MAEPTFEELMAAPDADMNQSAEPSFDDLMAAPDASVTDVPLATPTKRPTFMQDVNKVLDKSRKNLSDVYEQYATEAPTGYRKQRTVGLTDVAAHTAIQGLITPIVGIFGEAVTHSARSLYDTAVEMGIPLKESVKSLGNTFSAFVPDIVEEPVKKAVISGLELASSKLTTASDSFEKLRKEDPNAASYIEGVVDIALMYAPPNVKVNASPTPVSRLAIPVEKALKKQRMSFLTDLASPVETKDVWKQATIDNRITKQGMFTPAKIAPTEEAKIASTVLEKIPTVKYSNSIFRNANAVSDYLGNSVKIVQSNLDRIKMPVATITTVADTRLDNAVSQLVHKNLLSGNAARYGVEAADEMKRLIADENNTLGGILRARKGFDAWVKAQKSSALDNPEKLSALNVAVRSIRNEANNMINDGVSLYEGKIGRKLPFNYKEKLREQSILIETLENSIAPKVAEAQASIFGEVFQNASRVLHLKDGAVKEYAVIAGLTTYGAATALAPYAPVVIAVGGGAMGTSAFLRSPKAKQLLISGIKLSDKAIGVAKNPEMLLKLKADRAAMIDLLNQYQQDTE